MIQRTFSGAEWVILDGCPRSIEQAADLSSGGLEVMSAPCAAAAVGLRSGLHEYFFNSAAPRKALVYCAIPNITYLFELFFKIIFKFLK